MWAAQQFLAQHKTCASIIQARWRCASAKENFTKTVQNIIFNQSVVRMWSARMHRIQKIRDIIVVQSIVRRKSAVEKFRLMVSAYFIEQQWISFLDGKSLSQIRPHTSFIKTIPGAWLALRTMAAIKIATAWKSYHCLLSYKRFVRGKLMGVRVNTCIFISNLAAL